MEWRVEAHVELHERTDQHASPKPPRGLLSQECTAVKPNTPHTSFQGIFTHCAQPAMATPMLDQFLGQMSRLIASKDSSELAAFLIIEPPYADSYNIVIGELRRSHPKGGNNDSALEAKCEDKLLAIRSGSDGALGYSSGWTTFARFIVVYLCFLRDVNVQDLLTTYNLMSDLLE